MQTLRSLIPLACLMTLMGTGEAHAVDLSGAMACHDRSTPRERLQCYDDATGYLPDVLAMAKRETDAPPPHTRYGRFLDGLFNGQTDATGARLTVMDPATGATEAIAEKGSDAFDELLKSDPKEQDLYLTIMGRETGATAGVARLVIACEQDITQIVVLWNGVLKAGAGAAPARLYTDDRTTDPLRTTMRVIDNGHATRAPRGLEAIALLKAVRARNRLHIAVDQEKGETRSALFDIDGLAQHLRPLARRCGWS